MLQYNITGVKAPLKPMIIELDINEAPPPLTLLINPDSLDIRYTSKVIESRVRWTNSRESSYILQTHHDELDTLTANCTSAMFYSNKGLSTTEREKTLAWQNMQQVISIYRNNGINFDKKPGRRGVIKSIGRVIIVYDSVLYRGSFENFNISETDDKPFNIAFSFDFKITKGIDLRGLSNPILQQQIGI
jgi:hypothetical protein